VAKIALGWPAYLCALAIMGMILVRGKTPLALPQQAALPGQPRSASEPDTAAEPPA